MQKRTRFTTDQIKTLNLKVTDDTLPVDLRKDIYHDLMDEVLNPDEEFDPETFDPMKGVEGYDAAKRPRVLPPRRLPTMGLKPKQLFDGQMVGMFESKQDLYLLIAWLSERLSDAEDEISALNGAKIKK